MSPLAITPPYRMLRSLGLSYFVNKLMSHRLVVVWVRSGNWIWVSEYKGEQPTSIIFSRLTKPKLCSWHHLSGSHDDTESRARTQVPMSHPHLLSPVERHLWGFKTEWVKAIFPFSHKTNTILILRLIWSKSEKDNTQQFLSGFHQLPPENSRTCANMLYKEALLTTAAQNGFGLVLSHLRFPLFLNGKYQRKDSLEMQ